MQPARLVYCRTGYDGESVQALYKRDADLYERALCKATLCGLVDNTAAISDGYSTRYCIL